MSRRVLASAVLVGACAVLLAAAAAAAALSPLNRGRLEGRTAQGRGIVFQVAGNGLKLRHFAVRLKCRDGGILIDEESGFQRTALRHGGSFRDDQVGNTDEVRFQGRLHGRAARGRLRVTDRLGHVRCDSRWLAFSARVGRPG